MSSIAKYEALEREYWRLLDAGHDGFADEILTELDDAWFDLSDDERSLLNARDTALSTA